MIDNSASLLSWLHPEPILASLMSINNNDIVSIHSGQAEAGEFYSNANAFFAVEENLYEKEMPFEEYFDLEDGAEELEYIFSLFIHLTDGDE